MKLRTYPTLFVLRTVARLAWALVDLSSSLYTLSERLEGSVDRLALRWRLDIGEVLAPLRTEHSAD
jgi:hypothetical protein